MFRKYKVEGENIMSLHKELINQGFKWSTKDGTYCKMIEEKDKDNMRKFLRLLGLRLIRSGDELKKG